MFFLLFKETLTVNQLLKLKRPLTIKEYVTNNNYVKI